MITILFQAKSDYRGRPATFDGGPGKGTAQGLTTRSEKSCLSNWMLCGEMREDGAKPMTSRYFHFPLKPVRQHRKLSHREGIETLCTDPGRWLTLSICSLVARCGMVRKIPGPLGN